MNLTKNTIISGNANKCFADHATGCVALEEKYCDSCGYEGCKFYKTKEQLKQETTKAMYINMIKGIDLSKYKIKGMRY